MFSGCPAGRNKNATKNGTLAGEQTPSAESASEPLPAWVAPYQEIAARIIQETLRENNAYARLAELCDTIGARLSGSAALDKAINWAVRVLTEDGQENVRKEPVMVPHWVRGEESLLLVEPREEKLSMLGLGGSVGTPPEGIRAEVVVVSSEEELKALGERAKGKIVLFNNPMPAYDPEKGAGYGEAVRFRNHGARLAAEQGAVAALVRSVTAHSLNTPHTGATRYGDTPQKIPAAAVSVEAAELLARLAARGEKVVVHLSMQARDEGQAPSANVVAELRGSTMPEEIVVIGGHIDSWDVGQGAHDDGAGCVIAMEALAVLRRLGLQPKRTIRVVLFTNEENGLAGAFQYAKDHEDELPRHAAAIEADTGGFAPTGLWVEFEDKEKEARAALQVKELLQLLRPLGATEVKTGHSGADLIPLGPAGVPRFGLGMEGDRYFDYHHSEADTLDKVDPKDLSESVAAMAVVAYVLADMPGRIGEMK